MTINIKKAKRKQPAVITTPAVSIQEPAYVLDAHGFNKRATTTMFMPNTEVVMRAAGIKIRPLDHAFTHMLARLLTLKPYPIGCAVCHRQAFLDLVMQDRADVANFYLVCQACRTYTSVQVKLSEIQAMARRTMAMANSLSDMLAESVGRQLLSHNCEFWEERQTKAPAIRLCPKDYDSVVATLFRPVRGGGFPVFYHGGVAIMMSVIALPVLQYTTVQDLLHSLVEFTVAPCPSCGAPNYFECARSCTRPRTAIETRLIWRD